MNDPSSPAKDVASSRSDLSHFSHSTDVSIPMPSLRDSSQVLNLHVLRQISCGPRCSCSCHRTQRVKSPRVLDNLIGRIFLGYNGFPSVIGRCSASTCGLSSPAFTRVTYRFPAWFWQRAVQVVLSCNEACGPELLIRLPHVRSFNCDWFRCVRKGDIEGMKCVLQSKQANRTSMCKHFLKGFS